MSHSHIIAHDVEKCLETKEISINTLLSLAPSSTSYTRLAISLRA